MDFVEYMQMNTGKLYVYYFYDIYCIFETAVKEKYTI
jgi:hypothetical protein